MFDNCTIFLYSFTPRLIYLFIYLLLFCGTILSQVISVDIYTCIIWNICIYVCVDVLFVYLVPHKAGMVLNVALKWGAPQSARFPESSFENSSVHSIFTFRHNSSIEQSTEPWPFFRRKKISGALREDPVGLNH